MTTVAHETVTYGVTDFKVAPLTADTTTAPTYGALVDVPGIDSVSMNPNLVTAELKGDGKVLAKKGSIDKFGFSATYGKIALGALAVFLGGTVTDGGASPASTATWALGGKNSLPYFKSEFQILDTEIGDVHIVAYKCQVTGGTLVTQSTDNFGQPTVDFDAIPSQADPDMFVEVVFNETAVDITV